MKRENIAEENLCTTYKRKSNKGKAMSFDSGLKGLGVMIRWNIHLDRQK